MAQKSLAANKNPKRKSASWSVILRKRLAHTFASPANRILLLQIGIMIIAALLRIGAANTRFVVYSQNSYYDEYLMLEQSRLDEYFTPEAENGRTMIKTLTFPWFLNLSRTLHIPFNTLMGLLWIASALCVWSMMRKWTSSRWICLFAYLFVLFCPIGFENNNGVHIYRNLILAPFLFIFFSLLVSLVLCCWKRPAKKKLPALWLILGLCIMYPAVYYIKEDGFWCRPVLYLFLGLAALGLVWTMLKRRIPIFKGILVLLCLFLPSLCFGYQTGRYLDANEKAFGYREITVRTDGPIQELASLVYQIPSKNRDLRIWAPKDAIQKAIDVSPTLKSMEDFLYAFEKYAWEDGQQIAGDFLPWKILYGWQAMRTYQNVGNIQKMIPVFKQIAREVQTAFDDGRLQKQTGRISLTDSIGSRSPEEILVIFPDLLYAIDTAITLNGYDPVPPDPVNEVQDFLASFENELGMKLTAPQNEQEQARWEKQKAASTRVAQWDFGIYRLILPVLFWGGLASWGWEIYLRWFKGKGRKNRQTLSSSSKGTRPVNRTLLNQAEARTKKGRQIQRDQRILSGLVLLLVFILVGIAVAYEFCIVWFQQFLYYQTTEAGRKSYWVLYYSSSMIPMLYLALLLMIPFDLQALRKLLQSLVRRFRLQHKASTRTAR